MYLDNLVKLANMLDKNNLKSVADKVDDIIFNLSEKEKNNRILNNVVTASKLKYIYSSSLLESSIELYKISENIENEEIKKEIEKSSEELFNLAKEAGIMDYVKDVGRGIWSYLTSPFTSSQNYGRYVRAQSRTKQIINEMRTRITKYHEEKNNDKKKAMLNSIVSYLMNQINFFDEIASSAVIKNDKNSNDLGNMVSYIIENCINSIRGRQSPEESIAVLNRALMNTITGRNIQGRTPQQNQNEYTQQRNNVGNKERAFNPNVRDRKVYYIKAYNADKFIKKHGKDIFEDICNDFDINPNINEWDRFKGEYGERRFMIDKNTALAIQNKYPQYSKDLLGGKEAPTENYSIDNLSVSRSAVPEQNNRSKEMIDEGERKIRENRYDGF